MERLVLVNDLQKFSRYPKPEENIKGLKLCNVMDVCRAYNFGLIINGCFK